MELERAVPQLYSVNQENQQIQESILDLVVSWPGGTRQFFPDVIVRSVFSGRYNATHSIPGVAACAGDAEKRTRYGSEVLALSWEHLGRLSAAGASSLCMLASQAEVCGNTRMSLGALATRWREAVRALPPVRAGGHVHACAREGVGAAADKRAPLRAWAWLQKQQLSAATMFHLIMIFKVLDSSSSSSSRSSSSSSSSISSSSNSSSSSSKRRSRSMVQRQLTTARWSKGSCS